MDFQRKAQTVMLKSE